MFQSILTPLVRQNYREVSVPISIGVWCLSLIILLLWPLSAEASSDRVDQFEEAQKQFEAGKYDQAYAAFMKLSDNPVAQFYIGYMHLHGRGVPRNEELALDWYRKSARKGYPKAQYNIALLLDKKETPESDERAAEWYLRAASNGVPEAQGNLGYLYHHGKGVEKDIDKAFYWISRASDNGLPAAQFTLGTYYHLGLSVEKDVSRAIDYYVLAARQGHIPAMENLGVAYARGDGVRRDLSKTYKWFLIAKQYGHAGIVEEIPKIEKELTDQEIASAKEKADAWVRSYK